MQLKGKSLFMKICLSISITTSLGTSTPSADVREYLKAPPARVIAGRWGHRRLGPGPSMYQPSGLDFSEWQFFVCKMQVASTLPRGPRIPVLAHAVKGYALGTALSSGK